MCKSAVKINYKQNLFINFTLVMHFLPPVALVLMTATLHYTGKVLQLPSTSLVVTHRQIKCTKPREISYDYDACYSLMEFVETNKRIFTVSNLDWIESDKYWSSKFICYLYAIVKLVCLTWQYTFWCNDIVSTHSLDVGDLLRPRSHRLVS